MDRFAQAAASPAMQLIYLLNRRRLLFVATLLIARKVVVVEREVTNDGDIGLWNGEVGPSLGFHGRLSKRCTHTTHTHIHTHPQTK